MWLTSRAVVLEEKSGVVTGDGGRQMHMSQQN